MAERFSFHPDIEKMLSFIVNASSSFTKDIFLRDLLSYSSDALDEIRYESSTGKSKLDGLSIQVVPDKASKRKTLSITDNGVGMTKSDLVSNLGTIATTNISELLEELQAGADVNMIGQFGVGLYSAYLVAEKVVVTTKHDGDKQFIWESEARGSFTITEDTFGEQIGRGTKITLYLRDDQLDYLEQRKLKDLVKKHSKFISYPIYLWTQKINWTMKMRKKVKEVSRVSELIKKENPIWLRKPEDITKEEYTSFYKSLTNDEVDYLGVKHFSVQGRLNLKAILFVPRRDPFDSFNDRKDLNNIKLCVGGVFIMANSKEFFPEYLSFVKGVVDCDDLPLDISTRRIQENQILGVIKGCLKEKCFELFSEIAENKREYQKFYEVYAKNIYAGNRDGYSVPRNFRDLVRYHSTESGDEMTSLKDYVARMQKGQRWIYYTIGESKNDVENSPLLEKLTDSGYEVLFMIRTIDVSVHLLEGYGGHSLKRVTRALPEMPWEWDPRYLQRRMSARDSQYM